MLTRYRSIFATIWFTFDQSHLFFTCSTWQQIFGQYGSFIQKYVNIFFPSIQATINTGPFRQAYPTWIYSNLNHMLYIGTTKEFVYSD